MENPTDLHKMLNINKQKVYGLHLMALATVQEVKINFCKLQ